MLPISFYVSFFDTAVGLFVFVIIIHDWYLLVRSLVRIHPRRPKNLLTYLIRYSDYLPTNTSSTFDNTQNSYNVSKILTTEFSFGLTKYKNHSPMFLVPTFALDYGLSFTELTAAIVHAIIFNGKEVWYRFKAARTQEPNIHMKKMTKCKEVSDSWYGVLFVVSIALGLAATLGFNS